MERQGKASLRCNWRAMRVPMAAEEADNLRREQMRVEVHHRQHERIDGHAKRLCPGRPQPGGSVPNGSHRIMCSDSSS